MPSYVLLEKITVGAAGASSVTFSGIPQTGYTDLVLKSSIRTSRAAYHESLTMSFNGLTTNRTNRRIYGDGASAASTSDTTMYGGQAAGATATASTFGSETTYIPNYAGTTYNKSSTNDAVSENNAASALAMLNANLWSSTAAITSITLTPENSGTIQQYSTFYLYGVAALGTTPAIVPYATGGDTIMTDGTYWYHTFVSSGTFTPQKGLSCDYLVVAGGGGGAGQYYYPQGGGGAGGLRSTVTATGGGGSLESKLSLASGTSYTVTIGAGGAGATGPLGGAASTHRGTQGSNSVFSTITSVGGGGGAASDSAATSGGSGGGAGDVSGGAGTAGQGYAGGASGGGGGWSTGGGGGGAGAVGGNGTNPTPGAGGIGVQLTAFATPTGTGANSGYYAGGGGGASYDSLSVGAGGSGGGGAGSSTSSGVAGTANTGGGGGAGSKYFSTFYNGGNGGSGIVIVRYAV